MPNQPATNQSRRNLWIAAAVLLMGSAGAEAALVVNNNAAPGTSEEVAHTSAREVLEHNQGYGHACRRGLREAVRRRRVGVTSHHDGDHDANDAYDATYAGACHAFCG